MNSNIDYDSTAYDTSTLKLSCITEGASEDVYKDILSCIGGPKETCNKHGDIYTTLMAESTHDREVHCEYVRIEWNLAVGNLKRESCHILEING